MQHTEKHSLIPWTLKVCAAVLSLFGIGIIPLSAQSVLSGTVVSASDGQPLVGAYVLVQGTNVGTSTDVDGTFRLDVSSGTILEVSQMGYVTRQVKASDGVKIALEEDQLWLDDVVVVGYGVQKKKLVTGSTVQVKGEDIAKLNTVDVLGALQSQSPGVNIVQNNGFLGSGFKVNIRGLGTIGDSAPLYVVDGVANGSISALNPSDIESIDVLKDAASAAIYGARAANGVILITTKKGKEGQASVTYDGYYGLQNLYKIPTLLSANEYMQIQDESRMMDGLAPYNWENYIGSRIYKAIKEEGWTGTNWLKEITNEDAPVQNHSVNVTGGSKTGTYSIGLAYTGQDATMGVPSSIPHLDRYNFRVNSENTVFKKGSLDILKVGQTLNYRYQKTTGAFATEGIYWNGVHNMLVMSPLMPAYNSDGSYYVFKDRVADGYNWDTANGAAKNPIAYMDYASNQNVSKSHYLQASVYAVLQPIANLNIKSQFGYMMSASSSRSYMPEYDLDATAKREMDQVSQSMSLSNRWSWENTASYSFNIAEHQIDALIGSSLEKWGYGESLSASNVNSNFGDLEHAYLSNVSTTPSSMSSISGSPSQKNSIASFFVRANWNWKEKFMASATMRADGSSVFARGYRWGYFPSFSAGWVITNEDFFKGLGLDGVLDFFKLRASWGQNGNCNVTGFQYLSLVTSNNGYGGYVFGDVIDKRDIGTYAYKLTNSELKWETSEQTNIGFDARLFGNRLGVEFDWYNKLTKDWLVVAPVLYSYGANAPYVNGGNVKNQGLEFGLHWNDNLGDVFYGINLTGAHNKNKVTKIANADGIIHGTGSIPWEGAEELYRAEVGMPIGYFYGYKTAGVFQNQAEIDAYEGALLNGNNTNPGDVIYVDNNNDGVIDAKDRTMIGDPHPDFTLGLSFNVEWKGIDLSVSGFGAFGQQIFKCYRDFSSSPLNNYTTDILKRWTGEGSSNKYPRLASSSNSNWNKISSLYIEDGDYFKVQNITLGYDIAKAFKKFPLKTCRVYVTGQNLFTFTSYSGMDPEIGYGGGSGWAQGIDLGYYPSARTILFGVNLKF
ncbi:MAG TPA: SusC/RagA family protein [Rikenellaceae bacterium]|nr:SusC/RagA family protein [Rikenellaceae bacterium]